MKISNIELRFCSICPNRELCIPESDFPLLRIMGEKFSHRDFLYIKKDDFIFKDGDSADGVFCVYHGNVKVFRIDENNKEVILHNTTDGDCIGFNSIIDGHYIHSAKAIEDSFCCYLRIAEVKMLIKNKKPIAEKILAGH